MNPLRLLLPLLLLLLSACHADQQKMVDKMTAPEDKARAMGYIGLLRVHDFDALRKATDPSLDAAKVAESLRGMASVLPAQDPVSIKQVGMQNLSQGEAATVNLTFEYQYPDRWLLINVATKTQKGVTTIVGFGVTPEQQSLEETYAFHFGGQTPAHYVILAVTLLMPLLTLYALVLCIRTPIARRKWLWLLFVMTGIGKASLNWSTGQWIIHPFSVLLMGATAYAPLYGPWTLSFALPVGAVVFLIMRKRLAAPATPA